jgi:hypothetical protein
MAHAQQQILDALQALLAAGGTVAAARVFVDRVDPLQPTELPAISIEEGDNGESAEVVFLDGNQQRELAVTIDCVLTDATDTGPASRAFGLQVEKLIASSSTVAALCRLGYSITSSRLISRGDTDRRLASRQQSWRFSYAINPTAPDVIL